MTPPCLEIAHTATWLAEAVRTRRLTPEETIEAALNRIAVNDGRTHAFAVVRGDRARAEAAELARRTDLASLPLAGVPLAVKDDVAVIGEPLRYGSRALDPTPQRVDDELVRRLRAAGAVIVGITTCPEAMLWPTTDDADGITRNPWDERLSAGGSSGGSAAAVAMGMVPLAVGDDGLGSIRIPAAVCGVVGVKPGRGLVLPYDTSPEGWYGLAEPGPIAATVEDAALLLSVLASRPELARVDQAVDPMRVAVSVNPPIPGVRVDPDVVRLTFRAAAALRAAGASVHRRRIRYPAVTARAAMVRWFAVAALALAAAPDPCLLQPRTRVHGRIGVTARRFVRDSDAENWRCRALRLFDSADVLLCPVLATGALPAVRWSQRSWAVNVHGSLITGGFSGAWNLAGFPAVAVPAGRHPRSGMPVGVQLVGPPESEGRLMAVAAVLQRLRPWPLSAPGDAAVARRNRT